MYIYIFFFNVGVDTHCRAEQQRAGSIHVLCVQNGESGLTCSCSHLNPGLRNQGSREARKQVLNSINHLSIHPSGPYSVQSVGAAEAVFLAIGHNPGRVATLTG